MLDWDEMVEKKRKKEEKRIKMARKLANMESISTNSQEKEVAATSAVSKGLSMVLEKMVSDNLEH